MTHFRPLITSAAVARTASMIAVSLALAACGGTNPATGAPVPSALAGSPSSSTSPPVEVASDTPPPGPSPTYPDLPSPDAFAFPADAVIAFYEGEGFVCGATKPSTNADGYDVRRCKLVTGEQTIMLSVSSDERGAIGNASMGVLASDGVTMPSPQDAFDTLSGFLGATLGGQVGTTAMEWLAPNLGEIEATTRSSNGLTVRTYTVADGTQAGIYVEVSSPAYLAAPAPAP